MRTDFDAVIVGAGPAGSTAAILLARAGWSVALVEKQRFPRRKVCGECIAASNLPLLEALGIGPAFEAAAGPELRTVVFMRGEDQVAAGIPEAAHGKYPWGRALGRETLDTLLLERARLAGAVVFQPWSVQAIEGEVGAWRCRVRALERDEDHILRAPIAIAAHGSWEVLPSGRPGRRIARRQSDLFAFKANFRHASLRDGLLPVLSFVGGYGGMVVADDGVATLACCIRADRLESARRLVPGERAGEVVEALVKRECLGVRQALTAAARDGAWLAAGPIDPGIRLRAHEGLFRIGNAAGEAHPIIGEGISMALQSAWMLCSALLQAESRERAADIGWQRHVARDFAAQWRRQFATRLRLAAAFAHLAARPVSALPLMALVKGWPGLLTLGARWSGKAVCAVDLSSVTPLRSETEPLQMPGTCHHLHDPARLKNRL